MRLAAFVGFALFLGAGTWSFSAGPVAQRPGSVEFAGTTPCGESSRMFLGGIDAGAACHAITWRIRLERPLLDERASWSLTATYGVPAPSNPNAMIDGPKVALKGTWTTMKSAAVYLLTSEARRTARLVALSDDLVHLLDEDDRLMLGTAGWSYTLNRVDRMEKPGSPSLAPDMSYTISPRSSGSSVFGLFEGRTPCTGIVRELKITPVSGCLKVKWRVTLFQNPQTSQPTAYKIESSLHRERAREGSWRIVRGTTSDRGDVVYQLDATATEGPLRLFSSFGDDRVLFFQGQNGSLFVGNTDFSYTLNRVGP